MPPADNDEQAQQMGPCCDHNAMLTTFVLEYLGALGLDTAAKEAEVLQDMLNTANFSSQTLEQKITLGDLYFYRYFYTKTNDGDQRSILNPSNWPTTPFVSDEAIATACADNTSTPPCEHQDFILQWDSMPQEILDHINDPQSFINQMGTETISALLKDLLKNDGSVGHDNAFTIDEFFRPFITHYEKTTPTNQRGVCYWTELREFAFRSIQLDAGNENMEMTAINMGNYINLYNDAVAVASNNQTSDQP